MPKPKRSKVERSSKDEESEDSAGEESDISTEIIQADFEAFAPSEKDVNGIKSLLQQLLPESSINTSKLAELITKQTDIGCVHKAAEEESDNDQTMDTDEQDVYGLVTVIDVTSDKDECVRQLRAMLRDRYVESTKKAKGNKSDEKTTILFDHLWTPDESKPIGWVINERLVNIPFQIAAPSFESLLMELNDSGKKYHNFVAILKVHKLDGSGDADGGESSSNSTSGSSRRNKKRNKGKRTENADMVIYSNSEEELLFEECAGYFDYCVSGNVMSGECGERHTEDGSYKPYRRVIMFDSNAMEKFVTKLKAISP